MKIAVITNNIISAATIAICIGNVKNQKGKTYSFAEYSNNIEDMVDGFEAAGYIKAEDDVNVYTVTWYCEDDIILSSDKQNYTTSFDDMKYIFTDKRQHDIVKNILNGNDINVIYNAASLDVFIPIYHSCGCSKRFQNILLTTVSPYGFKEAVSNATSIEDSQKAFISIDTAKKIFWLCDVNLKIAMASAVPSPYRLSLKEILVLMALTERHNQRTSFKAHDCYTISGEFRTTSGEAFLASHKKELRFLDKKSAYDTISALPSKVVVEKFIKDKEKEYADGPLDFRTAIIIAAKEYGYSQKTASNALYDLYQKGHITSPNTDSRAFISGSQEEIIKVAKLLKKSKTYGHILNHLDDTDFKIAIRYISADDKQAIVPTPFILKKPFTDEMLGMYTIITRETLKACLPPIVKKVYKIALTAGNIEFRTTSTSIISKGYSILEKPKVYKNDVPDNIEEGDHLSATYSLKIVQKSPKTNYTQKELLDLFAGKRRQLSSLPEISKIIQHLKEGNLISKNKNTIYPTSDGVNYINNFLPVSELFSIGTLAFWRKQFYEIEDSSSVDKAKILSENFIDKVKDDIKIWCNEITAAKGSTIFVPCPVCHTNIKKSSSKYFCPSCGFITDIMCDGKLITERQLGYISVHDSSPIVGGFTFGKGRLEVVRENKGYIRSSLFTKEPCPVCKKEKMYIDNENQKLICKNSTCNFEIAFRLFNHEFTHKEFANLLNEGRTPIIQNVRLKQGAASGYFFIGQDKKIKFFAEY